MMRRDRAKPARHARCRASHALACAWLAGALLVPGALGDEARRVARAEAGGRLEIIGDARVLHVAGAPYDMGWQHGRLLRERIRAWTSRRTRPDVLPAARAGFWRDLPEPIQQELRGMADGARVPLGAVLDLQAAYAALLAGTSCQTRDAAAWGQATADAALLHGHSICLDGQAALGDLQDGALLVVAVPCNGLPHAYPAWAGFAGVSSGINASGVSVGVCPCESSDTTRSGLPTPFLAKEVLRRADSADAARKLLALLPRTHASSFVVADAAQGSAAAVEVTSSLCRLVSPANRAVATLERPATPDVVRRTRRFVHPDTAATQPDGGAAARWADWGLSQSLVHYYRRLDADKLLVALRDRPARLVPLCEAVYEPAARAVWLAHPRAGTPTTLRRFPLADLWDERPGAIAARELQGSKAAPVFGLDTCETTLQPLHDPDPEVNKLLELYNFPADPFPWRLRQIDEADAYTVHHLSLPSPTPYAMLECSTVHGEYYLPKGNEGTSPAAIVLHILDGRFLVARSICRHFAAGGVPALLVQMPYYGQRRVRGTSLYRTFMGDPKRMFDAIQGAVVDVRRAACWLQNRREVDPGRVGLVGVSLGAIEAALVAGVDRRFARTVLVLGGGDPARVLWTAPETEVVRERFEQRGYTFDQVREACRPIDPITFAHRADRRRILMINASNDTTVLRDTTVRLWEAYGKPTIHWYPAGHYSMGIFVPTILPAALEFIKNAPQATE